MLALLAGCRDGTDNHPLGRRPLPALRCHRFRSNAAGCGKHRGSGHTPSLYDYYICNNDASDADDDTDIIITKAGYLPFAAHHAGSDLHAGTHLPPAAPQA